MDRFFNLSYFVFKCFLFFIRIELTEFRLETLTMRKCLISVRE